MARDVKRQEKCFVNFVLINYCGLIKGLSAIEMVENTMTDYLQQIGDGL